MTDNIKSLFNQVLSKIPESPIGGDIAGPLMDKISSRQSQIEELIKAKKEGFLTQEDLETELDREKKIVEAELLSIKIAAKAEVQKAAQKAFKFILDAAL